MRNKKISLLLLACVVAIPMWSISATTAAAAEAGPDQGLVVFHRKSSMKGKAIRFNIEQDGRLIGQLLSGSTIEVALPPGNYSFSVRTPSLDGQDFVAITVEAGRTYRVEGEILWGWPAGRPKFGPVSESGGLAATGTPSTASLQTGSQQSPNTSSGALAGAALGSAASAPAVGAAVDKGRIGLKNFIGDWNLDMWSLASDGSKLVGKGVAQGSAEGESATRIMITEFQSAAFPAATGGGQFLLSYESGKGFLLVSSFRYSDEVLRFTGQYQADSGTYVFFLFGGSSGQFATGVARSSVRVEVRSLDNASWVADTFSSIDGRMTQVQSYRFTRQ